MLPLWDWRNMYSAKCLVPNFGEDVKYSTVEISNKITNYNCKLCEDFGEL